MGRENDSLDRLVVFLAKRDGIDKLVKTFQYTSKIAHWYLLSRNPSLAARAKNWEVSSGLSRKAFRSGRFLTGFNVLRASSNSDWRFQLLAVLGNAGEIVYFLFDHFIWLARIGVLDTHLAGRFCYISAFGEAFGYVFFVISDLIRIKQGIEIERRHRGDLLKLTNDSKLESSSRETATALKIKQTQAEIANIRFQRVMQMLAIAANVSDFIIAMQDVEPNPFVTHAVTLGISGLTSAWAGWYRNWPRELV